VNGPVSVNGDIHGWGWWVSGDYGDTLGTTFLPPNFFKGAAADYDPTTNSGKPRYCGKAISGGDSDDMMVNFGSNHAGGPTLPSPMALATSSRTPSTRGLSIKPPTPSAAAAGRSTAARVETVLRGTAISTRPIPTVCRAASSRRSDHVMAARSSARTRTEAATIRAGDGLIFRVCFDQTERSSFYRLPSRRVKN
jgi:hypothetical protein